MSWLVRNKICSHKIRLWFDQSGGWIKLKQRHQSTILGLLAAHGPNGQVTHSLNTSSLLVVYGHSLVRSLQFTLSRGPSVWASSRRGAHSCVRYIPVVGCQKDWFVKHHPICLLFLTRVSCLCLAGQKCALRLTVSPWLSQVKHLQDHVMSCDVMWSFNCTQTS